MSVRWNVWFKSVVYALFWFSEKYVVFSNSELLVSVNRVHVCTRLSEWHHHWPETGSDGNVRVQAQLKERGHLSQKREGEEERERGELWRLRIMFYCCSEAGELCSSLKVHKKLIKTSSTTLFIHTPHTKNAMGLFIPLFHSFSPTLNKVLVWAGRGTGGLGWVRSVRWLGLLLRVTEISLQTCSFL